MDIRSQLLDLRRVSSDVLAQRAATPFVDDAFRKQRAKTARRYLILSGELEQAKELMNLNQHQLMNQYSNIPGYNFPVDFDPNSIRSPNVRAAFLALVRNNLIDSLPAMNRFRWMLGHEGSVYADTSRFFREAYSPSSAADRMEVERLIDRYPISDAERWDIVEQFQLLGHSTQINMKF